MDAENRMFPTEKLAITWGIIIVLTVVSVLKGSGNDSPFDIERCDQVDWILFWILQVICVLFEIVALYLVRAEYLRKVACGYEFT